MVVVQLCAAMVVVQLCAAMVVVQLSAAMVVVQLLISQFWIYITNYIYYCTVRESLKNASVYKLFGNY